MSKNNNYIIEIIPVGEKLKGKSFATFNKLRVRTNRLVKKRMEQWMNAVLIKNNIFINNLTMTRREIVEIYEKNHISLIDEGDYYRIYKEGKIIGEWCNNRVVQFNNNGCLEVKIKYSIT